MAEDQKISQFSTITAKQAHDAATPGYIPYVDPTASSGEKNKKMLKADLTRLGRYTPRKVISTSSYTLTADDFIAYSIFEMTYNGAKTFTIPTGLEVDYPAVIFNEGTGDIEIVAGSGLTLTGSGTVAEGGDACIYPLASNRVRIVGGSGESSGGGGGDVTPPTIVSVTATDEHTIDVVLSETVTGTLGFSFEDGLSGLTVSSRTLIGGNTIRHVISETMTDASVLTYDYALGNIEDTAGNALANTSGAVTNDIEAGGGSYIDSIDWHSRVDPAVGVTTRVAGSDTFVTALADQVPGNGSEFDYTQGVEANQPKLIAAGVDGKPGIQIGADLFLATGTFTNMAAPFTRIAVVQFNSPLPGGAVKYFLHQTGGGDGGNLGCYTANQFFAAAGAVLQDTSVTPVADTPYIIIIEFNTGATSKMWINSNVVAVTGDAGSGLLTGMTLGHGGGLGVGANGLIGDHMTYDGILTTEEREGVMNELKAKYGIA